MPRRISIPFILDIVFIDDAAQMSELNGQWHISRELSGSGGLVARAIHSRIYRTLRVGETPLPVFTAREYPGRESRQKQLELELDDLAAGGLALQRRDIQKLADYVTGKARDVNVGAAVQQIVGRLFEAGYAATQESYEDAKIIDEWPRCNPLRALRLRWTGRLSQAKERIWRKGHQDTHFIHATAIAMHNIVAAIENMGRLMEKTQGQIEMSAEEVVRRCLVAPPRLLRQCMEETRLPFLKKQLRKGTLVIFELKKIHQAVGRNGPAFMEGEWSQCPARTVVPRILEEVWKAGKGRRGS